jgi:hypothetical protein
MFQWRLEESRVVEMLFRRHFLTAEGACSTSRQFMIGGPARWRQFAPVRARFGKEFQVE